MFLDPRIGESITLDGKVYTFTEAPNAPGIIYAEIGRKAKVYRVMNNGRAYALKAFKPRYRSLDTVENIQRIAAFQDVPGLSVAQRLVITPEAYPEVVGKNEALTYAILMPWVEGKSWFNYVTGKVAVDRQESLQLARALVNAVCELEQRDLAHCDLSSSNFIFSPDFNHVELIDIEEMFGQGLAEPKEKPKGTGGYSPEWVKKEGVWEAGADRYSTGILVSEILAWQFEDIRAASAGDAFFAEGEFGNKSKRFRMMSDRLEQIHPELSRLFKTVWYAESVEECPRVADWKRVLDLIREPELQVAPDFLKFGTLDLSVKPARELQATLEIKNVGGGLLTGRIQPNVPWLSVTPAEFSVVEGGESKHKVTLGATAPTRKGQTNYQFNNGIGLSTGQGTKTVSGSYSIVRPKSHLLTWVVVSIVLIGIIGVGGMLMATGLFAFMSAQAPRIVTKPISTLFPSQISTATNRALPTQTRSTPTVPVKSKPTTYQIPANSTGTSTGILVKKGQVIQFTASGTWCWGGNVDCSGPNGTIGRPNAEELPVTLGGQYFGTLIGDVGGWYFKIGQQAQVAMQSDGILYLLMNDRVGGYGDNEGNITVTVNPQPQLGTVPTIDSESAITQSLGNFGPQSGSLVFNTNSTDVVLNGAGVSLMNCIIDVTFYNPYSVGKNSWDYGLFFRDTGYDEQYRLTVFSDGGYQLQYIHQPTWDVVQAGYISNFDKSVNGSNKLHLEVRDAKADFSVNGTFIVTLNVSQKLKPGDVAVTTANYIGNGINGYSVRYENFTVEPLP